MLSQILKNILIERLIDAHGAKNSDAFASYADSVIIDFDFFNSYNDAIDFLVSNYKKLVIL